MKDPLQQGDRIRDAYEVVRLLGASELSSVYLTRGGDGQHHVVRQIRPPVDERQMDRVISHVTRELGLVGRFQLAGLPHISDSFVWGGHAYLVRSYVDDPTIIEVLDHIRGLPPENQVRGWMMQLLDIFGYLHGQQPPFIFSGLRPEMITLSKMGKIHIRDYPITCYLPGEIQWKYARRTAPGYISPEQERGEQPQPTSDVFNLAQLYFFMLTRKDPALYPYNRNLLTIARPDATEGLLTMLDGATRKNPGERIQTIGDLRMAMSGGIGSGRSEREIAFTLDTHHIKVENVKRGDTVRRKFKLKSKTGREIYGKIRSEQDWIRFKFDVFRSSSIDLDFSVNTFEFAPGETYRGVVQVDTDAGVDEVELEIVMESSLGSRLVRGLKSLFHKEPVDTEF